MASPPLSNHLPSARQSSLKSASPATSDAASTPLTAHSFQPEDDIWGTPPPGSPNTAHQNNPLGESHPSDIPRLRSTHTTAGYRDGVASARETAVQPGFDEGFLLGSSVGLRAGYLLGVVEGLVAGKENEAGGEPGVESCGSAAEGDLAPGRGSLRGELERMTEQLKIENLLNKEWVGDDGTWKWDVPGGGGVNEDDVTISMVANAHPVIRKWRRRVKEFMTVAGIKRGDGMRARSEDV